MDSVELCGRHLECWSHSKSEFLAESLITQDVHNNQAWDLLEGKTLFSARKEDGSFSDGVHLSELIAALGPPPADLLARHRERALEYWDENGEHVIVIASSTKSLTVLFRCRQLD